MLCRDHPPASEAHLVVRAACGVQAQALLIQLRHPQLQSHAISYQATLCQPLLVLTFDLLARTRPLLLQHAVKVSRDLCAERSGPSCVHTPSATRTWGRTPGTAAPCPTAESTAGFSHQTTALTTDESALRCHEQLERRQLCNRRCRHVPMLTHRSQLG